MARLPRIAVLGTGLSSAIALAALVDGGLDAQGVCSADPGPEAVDVLSTHGLEGRLRRVEAVTRFTWRGSGDGDGPFEILSNGARIGRFDAVVVADSGMAADPAGVGSPTAGATPGTGGRAGRFGGVFDPELDGVYLIGDGSLVGGDSHERISGRDTAAARNPATAPTMTAVRELAWAQGRWVGEYLRGRYRLPTRSGMLANPGLPRRRLGWERRGTAGYLARLENELRRGRARAAAAGYPLPLPPSAASTPAPTTTRVRP